MENFILDTTVSSMPSNLAARPLMSLEHSLAVTNNDFNTISDTVNGYLKQKFKIIPKNYT